MSQRWPGQRPRSFVSRQTYHYLRTREESRTRTDFARKSWALSYVWRSREELMQAMEFDAEGEAPP